MHTRQSISAALAEARRPLDGTGAARIAGLIGEGSLDDAIRQAFNDDARPALQDLLAYREARREQHDPQRLIGRLLQEADDLDRRCAALDAAAAECFGKAAYRRSRGDAELACEVLARGEAAEATASELREMALGLRLEGARIQARQESVTALTRIAARA